MARTITSGLFQDDLNTEIGRSERFPAVCTLNNEAKAGDKLNISGM